VNAFGRQSDQIRSHDEVQQRAVELRGVRGVEPVGAALDQRQLRARRALVGALAETSNGTTASESPWMTSVGMHNRHTRDHRVDTW